MTMSLEDVADALAARFAGVTSTSGEALATAPTAQLPNAISRGPVLLVYPPTGSLEVGMSQRRNDLFNFPVRLLRDPLDVPARSKALYAWFDALRDLPEADINLGLTYVSFGTPISTRLAIDGIQYAGAFFDLVELIVQVRVNEHVSTVQP